jgi:hypothetical protein
MADAGKQWRIADSYPPMLMVDFKPLLNRVMAELMMAAHVTCDEEWQVASMADTMAEFVIAQLRTQTQPRRLEVPHWITKEDE